VTGTNESLFQENPPILSYQNNLHSYCTCANEAGTQGGLKDHNVLHCNLSQPMEACYDVKTDLSLDSRCSNGNLQPKLASDQLRRGIRSTDDTDDVIDFTPLIISDDVFDESISIEILENNRSYTGPPTISKAVIKHSYMVSCEFANARRKRSTSDATVFADGYEISVSNDGSNYGEVVTLIVYDEECYSCNTVNVTCTAIETCPLTRAEDTETEKEQNGEKDENNIFLPFGIIAGLVVLGALIGLIVYKVKHKDIGQIDTAAKGNPTDDIFAINFATQNIPPTMKVLDQRYTPRLKNEYSSASRFSLDFQDGDRRTPDHLFLVENKYN
ncbi:Hypothetical predicted protein, partial [Mytilus galloprovincialis]